MARSFQKGSILGYVLVGVLLIAALVGGIFVVRNNLSRFKTPASTPQVATKDNKQATNSSSDDAVKQKAEADKKAAETKKAQEQAAADAAKKAQDQNAAVQREMASQNQSATTPTQNPQPTTATQTPHTGTAPASASGTDTDKLPHTGPTEMLFVSVTGAALLLGTTFAYVRSRASL